MDLDFTRKVCLVTGGSRGIGLSISRLFAMKNAQVVILYRSNHERAEQALDSLNGDGHMKISCDISDPNAISDTIEKVWSEFGQLDVLVNNAGIGFHHPVDSVDYSTWQEGWNKILQTNLIGQANMCYCTAQYMIRQKSGKIINVSSRGAFRGEPDQPAYGASKAGLNSLTQSLAHKLSQYNIFVGAVAPGFVETEMAFDRLKGEGGDYIRSQSPMNRVAHPDEVAEAVVLMAASNIWMTGSIFDVNGASYFRT